METNQFINLLKKGYQPEIVETNRDNFFENFFYYKRNIREFFVSFNNSSESEQENITSFLLNLYPLSDVFLSEILKNKKFDLSNQITLDTINYINNQFVEEFRNLNIDLDTKIERNLETLKGIQSIVDINQLKFNKLAKSKKDLLELKEKDEKLSREIKELENANISEIKDELVSKQKKYDELKQEKSEMNRHLDKIKHDINELAKHGDLKEKIFRCREIIQDLNLPRDYSDKQIYD